MDDGSHPGRGNGLRVGHGRARRRARVARRALSGPAIGSLGLTAGVIAGLLAARSRRQKGIGEAGSATRDAPLGRPRARGLRRGLAAAVRVDRVRARRRAPDARPLQLRRPAAALDLRAATSREALPSGRRIRSSRDERLRYPFGVDLLTAVFVQLGASLPVLLPVMGLAGAALAALALRRVGRGVRGRRLPVRRGARRASRCWRRGEIADYQSAVAWKSLYLALFVPQRGFLLALPAGLVLLWSWRRRLLRGEPTRRSRRGSKVSCGARCRSSTSTPSVRLAGLAAAWAFGGRRLRDGLPTLAWAAVPATWSVWQVTDGFRAASLVGWRPGWMIGAQDPLVFLLVNFGLFLPLALLALWRAVRERHREELLVLVPPLAVFAALFLVKLAPWEWDNTKVMLWCYVAVLPAVVRSRRGADAGLGAGGRRSRPVLLRGGERPRRLARPRAAPRGARRGRVRGSLPGPRGGEDVARRDRADLQPPGGAVRPPDRGGVRRAPLEPRARRRGRREGTRTPHAW